MQTYPSASSNASDASDALALAFARHPDQQFIRDL
jgi:hypothetical protein